MIKPSLLAAIGLVAASTAQSQTVPESDLRRHIEILAHDSFEGRKPGTAGGERTEAYMVEAFAKIGLQPGTREGTWRQSVRIPQRNPVSGTVRWTGRNGSIDVPAPELILLGHEARVQRNGLPVVFGGYGTAEELEGADLKNALVLRLVGKAPVAGETMSAGQLGARGVSALIDITPEGAGWEAVKPLWLKSRSSASAENIVAVEGAISPASLAQLLRGAGADLASLTQSASARGFRAKRLDLRAAVDAQTRMGSIETANIVGKIPGTSRLEEAVVLLAHWDHLGVCRPEGAADRICNGAVDNGSGTAILIEAARHLAAGPKPGRTIYILATTAEEMGMQGAKAFADAPPVAKDAIIAALNIDTTAIGPAGLPVAIIGRGNHPALETVIDQEVLRLGRKVDTDKEANVMITRQDGWAFGARGIPAMMVTGSVSDMKRLGTYLGGVYHGPEDDIAHMKDLAGAAEDATLHIAVARALADPARYQPPRR